MDDKKKLASKAIIFDLDDTLVAFDAVKDKSWRQVCDRYCRDRPGTQVEAVYNAILKISDWYWSDEIRQRLGRQDMLSARRKIVTTAFCELGLPVQDAMEVADHYSKVRLKNMYILPGSEEILTYFRHKGIKMALMTNGDAEGQWDKIYRFQLEQYFDPILIEGEMGFGKPDRRVYELAIAALKFPPEEICMIGDNLLWDVIAPRELGINSIWFDSQGQGLSMQAISMGTAQAPYYIIYQLTDLLRLFA